MPAILSRPVRRSSPDGVPAHRRLETPGFSPLSYALAFRGERKNRSGVKLAHLPVGASESTVIAGKSGEPVRLLFVVEAPSVVLVTPHKGGKALHGEAFTIRQDTDPRFAECFYVRVPRTRFSVTGYDPVALMNRAIETLSI